MDANSNVDSYLIGKSSAGELVFLDSTSNIEEYKLRAFLMVTHSLIDALPLGLVITSF